MQIRPYAAEDLAALVAVFTTSVHQLGACDYTPRQLDAWAPRSPELAAWRQRLQPLQTVVATEGATLTGFISYDLSGHIDLLYTSPSYARRGVASLLYRCVEGTFAAAGALEIFTQASSVARHFFERFGFTVTEEQDVLVRGCSLRRYAMRKALGQLQMRPDKRWSGRDA
jgi:putative acetyltransferase